MGDVTERTLALAALGGRSAEASSTAAGRDIGDAAVTAYGKVKQFLPARLRPRADAVRQALDPPRNDAPGVPAGTFGLLSAAVASRDVVTFGYVDGNGRRSERRVEPYRQVYRLLRWYLVAWDVDRGDWRSFRIDRIGRPQVTGRDPRTNVLESRGGLEQRTSDVVGDGAGAVGACSCPR